MESTNATFGSVSASPSASDDVNNAATTGPGGDLNVVKESPPSFNSEPDRKMPRSTAPSSENTSYNVNVDGGPSKSMKMSEFGDRGSATSPHLQETAQPVGLGPASGPGPSGDTSSHRMLQNQENIDTIVAEISKGLNMECMQWTQVFRESEQFEICSLTHVEKLLEDARAVEQDLLQQKDRLMSHLKLLSQTLKLS